MPVLTIPFGSEPGFRRPALVIQNDVLNKSNLNTTIVLPLTTNTLLAEFFGNVFLPKEKTYLSKDSVVVCSQIVVVDKMRLLEKAGKISDATLRSIVAAINSILGK